MKRGLCIVLVLFLFGCASTSTGRGGIDPVVYGGNIDTAFSAAVRAVADLGWTVKFSDKQAGIITAGTPVSLWTWGDEVTLILTPVDEKTTRIEANSKTLGQIVAYGKNKRNIERILAAIKEEN